jgi:hypothetical protein
VDVTQSLNALEQGDPHAAGRLLSLVYDELRRLAAQGMAQEKPGRTLQPTALGDDSTAAGWVPWRRPFRLAFPV